MKHINFLKTVSQKRHQELHRWFLITLLLVAISFILIGYFHLKNYIYLNQLKKEASILKKRAHNFEAVIKKHRSLKEQMETIAQQTATITSLKTHSHDSKNYFILLQSLQNQRIEPIECLIEQKKIQLKVVCPNQLVTKTLDILEKISFIKKSEIVSMQQQKNNLKLVKIKGEIKG